MMSRLSTEHRTIVLGRTLEASCAEVFAILADAERRRVLVTGGEELVVVYDETDFRVGGIDTFHFGPPNDLRFQGQACYNDIVPGRRIISTDTIDEGDLRVSVAIATLEFVPLGERSQLKLTAQIVSLREGEANENANDRYGAILDGLDRQLGGTGRAHPRPVVLR